MFRDLGGGTTCYFPLLPGKGFKRHAVVYVEGILWRGKEVPVAICYALTGGEGGGGGSCATCDSLMGGGGWKGVSTATCYTPTGHSQGGLVLRVATHL